MPPSYFLCNVDNAQLMKRSSIELILEKAIQDHFAPGIALHIACDGKTIYSGAQGYYTYDSSGSPVQSNTIFDIASITKAVVATGVLLLVDQGALRLSEPLSSFFSQLRKTSAGGITLWHLLTHTSNLAEIRLSTLKQQSTREKIIEAVSSFRVNEQEGKKVEYANINTFLLGEIITKVTNTTLDVFLKGKLLEPLGMSNTMFNPSERYWGRISPTSFEQGSKGVGTVHDPSARLLGGICGHAGLFSTTLDLSNFLEMWIGEGVFQGQHILSPTIASQAVSNQTRDYNLKTGLGWHLDNEEYLGDHAPHGTFFHPGFTGTIIAASPAKQITVSLLSNHTFSEKNDTLRKRVFFRHIFDEIFSWF